MSGISSMNTIIERGGDPTKFTGVIEDGSNGDVF